jgi:uncharacterized RDD family membrane protein YckC
MNTVEGSRTIMKNRRFKLHLQTLLFVGTAWLAFGAVAQEEPPAPPAPPEVEAPAPAAEPQVEAETDDTEADAGNESDESADDDEQRDRHHSHGNSIVRFGADAHLRPDEAADAVVSIFGSSTSEGEVFEAVVSIFGDTRVTGRVGEAAVTVFGNAYVDAPVHGDVVVTFGNLELGPNAEVHGEAVVIGGSLKADPQAEILGGRQEVTFVGEFGQFRWLRPWIEHCLLLGRPLAMEPGLEWAWGLALGFLILYVLLSLLFTSSVEKCVQTLETRPGESMIAALISVFLAPVFVILLAITVVGIILVPFFGIALFAAGLFGKAVVLAALGRRVTRFADSGPLAHVAVAVVVGGILVTAIYLIPVVGFIFYKLLGILGLGVVVYTMMLASRERRPVVASAAAGASMASPDMSPGVSDAVGGPTPAASTEPPPATAGVTPPVIALPRADFWVRMGALLIDAILVGIIANLIPGSGDIWLLALATYGAMMWKLKGTTVGGIILNLRVVRLDGRDIDWSTAIVRALGCFLSLAAVGLGFIWIALDPERQAWHDKIAGTVVVRTPRAGSLV